MSKMTHVIVHPKQYMAVNGKLQLVPKGTQVTLTDEQAESLGKKVVTLKEAETLDLSGSKNAAPVPPTPSDKK